MRQEICFDTRNTNLNPYLLNQFLRQGVEIKVSGAGRRKSVRKITPLETLFKNGVISQQQSAIADEYFKTFEISNISHHARPSYDGTSISAACSSFKEGGPSQAQMDASKKILAIYFKIGGISINYETDKKTFKTICLQLPEILNLVFEQRIKLCDVRKRLRINHYVLQDRIKKICEVLLDIEKTQI